MTLTSAPVPDPVDRRPEDAPALGPRELHLWHADLDRVVVDASVLEDVESGRAGRMERRSRKHFVASRVLLRRILAGYTGSLANALRFETAGEGKPRLAPFRDGLPRFNLSHAGPRWLLAVSRIEVGVDVEATDRPVDLERVARRVFRPAESHAVLRRRGDARRLTFFRTWTGREALVKACAEGMFTLSLRVTMEVQASGALALSGEDAARWTLLEVPVERPWVAAVAMPGHPDRVRSWRVR